LYDGDVLPTEIPLHRDQLEDHNPDHLYFVEVGGELALVFHREGRVYSVDTVQIADGLITAYRKVINPDKLMHV
jgi:RNA polymerase sigma-70 factor (ECF subfamily)